MSAKKGEVVRPWHTEVRRERVTSGDPRVALGQTDRTACSDTIDVWAFTDKANLVLMRDTNHEDHGWWIWTGCNDTEVLALCEQGELGT